jgi:flagellar biosynthesis anti-sigma factor FlgM
MRIPDVSTRLGLDPAKGPVRAGPGRGPDEAPPPSDERDRVRVSARSRQLSLAADGGVDAARVARLKSAVDEGTFRIDARAIAARIARVG